MGEVLLHPRPAPLVASATSATSSSPSQGGSHGYMDRAQRIAFLLAQAPELPAPPANWEASARQLIFFDATNGATCGPTSGLSYGKARLVVMSMGHSRLPPSAPTAAGTSAAR